MVILPLFGIKESSDASLMFKMSDTLESNPSNIYTIEQLNQQAADR